MVAIPRKRLNMPLAPLVAGGTALLVALLFALMPGRMLGDLVLDSGIAALVPAAEPPLGGTARAALILVGGSGIGLIVWFGLYLLVGTRSISVGGRGAGADRDAPPILRRADAHPDAPARRPLLAHRDLGTPFLDVRAPVHVVADEVRVPLERDLPVDLDLPMSAYDPHAVPARPADWSPLPPPPSRPQVFDEGERFETFELTPMVRTSQSATAPASEPSASIHALLDRLEKGVAKGAPSAAPPRESLQDSLAALRRLATAARSRC